MLIPTVERGLDRLIRATLPLPESVGDVSFDPPSGTWGAALSRLTVNLFLFDVQRSPQPPRPAAERTTPDGRVERRPPLPMVQLGYMVSAWAGNTQDEHELLGELLSCFLLHGVLPADLLPRPLDSSVQLSVAPADAMTRPKDIWSGIEGKLRPSFTVIATVALDTIAWAPVAPRVDRVQGLAAPTPSVVPPQQPSPGPALRRRRTPDGVVLESDEG
ncbi:MAG: DUF4255 domain-containing protein [Actinomycetes bacterium]